MAKLPFDPQILDPKNKVIYEAMLQKRQAKGAPFGGPYNALMNHPQLCEKIEALGFYLKFQGHLSREIYQFVVLAVAQYTGAEFEWDDHVNHAKASGVPENIISNLKKFGVFNYQFPAPFNFAAQVLCFTLVWKNIPADVQSDAIEAYSLLGYIELVVLSGFYQLFSTINQGFDISV